MKDLAFPAQDVIEYDRHGVCTKASHGGMTLRDYFAAKALQGMNASPELMVYITRDNGGFPFEKMAENAYKQADAMLKVRSSE